MTAEAFVLGGGREESFNNHPDIQLQARVVLGQKSGLWGKVEKEVESFPFQPMMGHC